MGTCGVTPYPESCLIHFQLSHCGKMNLPVVIILPA